MYKRGTVILTPFPFTDLSDTKVRPAVILSQGKIQDDVVVAYISSVKKNTTYAVQVKPSDTNGLKVQSGIVCHKIIAIDAKIILGELGTLENSYMQEINKKVSKILCL